MSWVTAAQGGTGGPSVPTDLDQIMDEEFLKQLWQQCENSSDRRKIRARMYKLREKRLREMVENDEESLGSLSITNQDKDEGDGSTERKTPNIQVKMILKGDGAQTDMISMQNIRMAGVTMRGVEPVKASSDDEIIEGRIQEVSKERTQRYNQVKNQYDQDEHLISKSSFSLQSNALAADSYQSMKNKEVRDSASPTRVIQRRDDSDSMFTSDEEKSSPFSTKKNPRKITERKISKDLGFTSNRNNDLKSSPTANTRRTITSAKQHTSSSSDVSPSSSPTRNSKRGRSQVGSVRTTGTRTSKFEETSKRNTDIKNEYNKLGAYISPNIGQGDEMIMEEEEEGVDESGNVVKMLVQTIRKKDGSECTSRRIATSTKVVDNEDEINEMLIGNPEHEVLERNVEEQVEKDGSKIKIITEKRLRPDGIEYTTKNVVKTAEIFDYALPEDIAYNEEDELVHIEESEEMDEQGISIRTIMETRKKDDGTEYVTKKVYKTSKIDTKITPSDDDEILDTNEMEEQQSDGTIVKTIIEKRKTKNGDIYTHRQIHKSRKMTLSSIDSLQGLPFMNNDDEVLDKKVKEEEKEDKTKVKIVTETRRRKDGTTYSFDYVLRSFQGTECDIKKMPIKAGDSNIAVSSDDKLIKEDVKEEVQKDGSTVKTIIERRKAKDGTEYLRHRIMRIPKLPEPILLVGSLEDEVLEEDVKERTLEDGTQCKAITERRRSSVTGAQYTLRRMSKLYNPQSSIIEGQDEIINENVTEEETTDGILVKTIIRRYQRGDGTYYTTHDVQKSYQSPVTVSVEGNEDDELIDRSYDERESNDGYVIKTIIETRCRSDGTHYTVERTEKVSKNSECLEVSFKGDSIKKGSPGDTVISCEEHEEPSEDGTMIKTILEVRQKADGTEYTNKTTIRSMQLLVPEHETSYIVIKSEKEEDNGFMPSLEDEVVYTRKKQETDEMGNAITIVIETRQSKTTGEKYNLTKKVHTTDVVMTNQGEKVLTNKTPLTNKTDDDKVPYGSVSALKNRFAPPKKDSSDSRKVNIDRVNTANRKKFFEEQAAKSLTTKTSNYKLKSEINAKPKEIPSPIVECNEINVVDSKKADTVSEKVESKLENVEIKTEKASVQRRKIGENSSRRSQLTLDLNKKPKTDSRSSDSSSPEQKPTRSKAAREPIRRKLNDSPKKSSPESRRKSPTESRVIKEPLTRLKSSTREGRSPLRSDTASSREGTPSGRSCCNRVHGSAEAKSPTKTSPVLRKRPSNERMKLNEQKRPESPTKTQTNSRLSKVTHKKPEIPKQDRLKTRKSEGKISPKKEPKEPIVDIPETPMVEDKNATGNFPLIEDVTSEPNLPYHSIHRPSLVSEPSDGQSSDNSKSAKRGSTKRTSPVKPFERRSSDKKIERRDSDKKIERRDSGKKFERKDSDKKIERRDSNKNIERRDSDKKIERRGSDRKITSRSSSSEIEKSPKKQPSSSTARRPLSIDTTRKAKSPEKEEAADIITPLVERSRSPFSKDSSPMPRSKEGSPASFKKEDSPSRFATGRAIDEGANINKIKRLERSNSNKKMIYEDLGDISSKLPGYLADIEYITDLTVLETLLQKAESYEERRVIRGHIRIVKKSTSGSQPRPRTASSTPNQFIKSNTASTPTPTRKTPSKTEVPKKFTVKKEPQQSTSDRNRTPTRDTYSPRKSSIEDNSSRRKLSSEDTSSSRRKTSTDERRKISNDSSNRKSSIEETGRKVSREENNRRKISGSSDLRKKSIEESRRKLSSDKFDERLSSVERESTTSRTNFSSTRKISSEEQSSLRKTSSSSRKISSEETRSVRKISSEETRSVRKISTEEKTTNQKSTSDSLKSSRKWNDSASKYTKASPIDEVRSDSMRVRRSLFDNKSSLTSKNIESKTGSERTSVNKFITSKFRTTDEKKKKKDAGGEPYIEPLRHQQQNNKVSSQLQTDVEKIVSPYGVGPTDDNGLPLVGLRALRRKAKAQEAPVEIKESAPEPSKKPDCEPLDSTGKPMFGIRSLRKSPPEKTTFTASQVVSETSSVSQMSHKATLLTEENHLSGSRVTAQPIPFQRKYTTHFK